MRTSLKNEDTKYKVIKYEHGRSLRRGDEEYKIIILAVFKASLQLAGFCLPYLY